MKTYRLHSSVKAITIVEIMVLSIIRNGKRIEITKIKIRSGFYALNCTHFPPQALPCSGAEGIISAE